MKDGDYFLWLSKVSGFGIKKKLRLIDFFGDAKAVFLASEKILRASRILSESDIVQVLKMQKDFCIDEYIDELNLKNICTTTIGDFDYPKMLLEIDDPPIALYYRGILPKNDSSFVSIVGSRRCSTYGKNVAFNLAKNLAKNKIVVVSGMASGIDTIAHKGAIEGKNSTIAVLGCGVEICYPAENKDIFEKIIVNGCVMSEFSPKTKPLPAFFPIRNRIISGLSKATVVVEASKRSGTLITADFALEQGREVFAVPGNITSPLSSGTNALIKDGADILTSYEDILNVLKIDNTIMKEDNSRINIIIENLSANEKIIYNLITDEPITVDEIVLQSKTIISVVQYALTMLEVKKLIQKQPGQKFIRSY